MKIENTLEKRINELIEKYPLFSRENNIIHELYFWVKDAVNSAIPNSPLIVTEGKIEGYSHNLKYTPNKNLINDLKGIIQYAQNKYVDKKGGKN